jgi:Zn finger protein HypA/HybF involved in hydrogenase expression
MAAQDNNQGILVTLRRGQSVDIPILAFGVVPEILDTAKSRPQAQIDPKGNCSCCGTTVQIESGRNFCSNCGSTFLTAEQIASGRVYWV